MLRKLLKCFGLVAALAAAHCAQAFTLWGPLETWQTTDLDYGDPRYYYFYVEPGLDGIELGGPKNFGEGSRLTTPIITYAFDDTFLEYFGAQGVAAVNAAFNVLNALPSSSSANLNSFLTDGDQQVNYTAQAMELMDLKSTVLYLMAEHMGLLGETHVFDLAARAKYAPPNCAYEYFVINRNYEPGTYNPSDYVNGHLYTYLIWDGCQVAVNVGDAVELPLDTTALRYSAVATGNNLQYGAYYLNFTRDDMGGLKYLYSKGNYAFQQLDSNSIVTGSSLSTWTGVNTTNGSVGVSNFVGVLGGAEKIRFVRVGFDSLLGTNFTPITYQYTLPYITNSQLFQLQISRTVSTPDIIFAASNLVATAPYFTDFELVKTGAFIQSPYVSLGGGITPSTIAPQELIILNNAGAIYYNYSPGFLDGLNYGEYPVFVWGSFDGSTNEPIVFPNGSSLAALEAQLTQGGAAISPNIWNPVPTANTNATTGAGGTGGAGGAPARVR